ncbi:uncharacterized protein [Antedon mediterranea]|uniref:uncharacterized protein isoform X2 n=1 Tax=Antedon mediterranea TaxID=105859 RepID=UPI003AF5F595
MQLNYKYVNVIREKNTMEHTLFLLAVWLLPSTSAFKCLQCNDIMMQDSDCKLIPSNVSIEVECSTFCFTKMHIAAGIDIDVERGCTEDEECDEEDLCGGITQTGLCSNCCRENNCNNGYPKGVVNSSNNILCKYYGYIFLIFAHAQMIMFNIFIDS